MLLFAELVLLLKVKNKKKYFAQSAIENIIILAIGLFIITLLVSIVYDRLDSMYVVQQQNAAQGVVDTLSEEINNTYFLGPGTVKNLTIVIPQLADLNKSFILGRALVLNINGTDVISSTKIEVRGNWPNSDGSYVFVLTAYSDYVGVSTQPISFTPAQVNDYLPQSASKDFNILISNSTASDLNYATFIEFPSDLTTGATVSSTSTSILVSHDSNLIVPFTMTCSSDSFGSHVGKIVFVPKNAADFNASLPVTLVCLR